MKRVLAFTFCLGLAAPLAAQTPVGEVGLYFPDTTRITWRAGINRNFLGPIGLGLYGTLIEGTKGLPNSWGGEADLSLFRGGRSGFYGLGSVGGGVQPSDRAHGWWTWSAGAGWEGYPASWLTVGVEGRWRLFHPGDQKGVELGVRLAFGGGDHGRGRLGGAAPSGSPPATLPAPLASIPPSSSSTSAEPVTLSIRAGTSSARDALIANVVHTARDEMGTPYKWGGQGEGGFDCSGLIRYAYGKEGISLPRRSVDQAREGSEVDRSLDALMPGDILVFRRSPTGPVSHVGLYLGDGEFIHSASNGVQVSRLSADDTYGKWWWARWAGARRIVAVP